MSKLRRLILNPFVLVLPVVALLGFGWQQMTRTAPLTNVASINMLAEEDAGPDSAQGLTKSWSVSPVNPQVAAMTTATTQDGSKLLAVESTNENTRATTLLTSPVISIEPNQTYMYKGVYTSTVPFDLIVRTTSKNEMTQQTIVGHYDAATSRTSVSTVLQPDPDANAVEFIYSFAGKGWLQLDNSSLEPNPVDSYMPPAPKQGVNLIPNAALSGDDTRTPDGWRFSTTGQHQATGDYVADTEAPYVRTQISDYRDGEATWRYEPVAATPHALLQFSVSYQSDAPIDVVAEYTLQSGERQLQTLATLLPATDWTTYKTTLQAPAQTSTVLVTPILRENGSVSTKNYQLHNISRPGAPTWRRPLVSITFDDGWQSSYDHSTPLLHARDLRATYYLNPSSLDTPQFMTSDEVDSLKRQGHELASHAVEHIDLTTLEASALEYQLEHAQQYFAQIHNQEAVNFAAPYGAVDSQVAHYAQKYYSSLRGTKNGINTRQNFDPYDLSVLYIGSKTSLKVIEDAIAETAARNGWLIMVYHRIDAAQTSESSITPTQLRQQLDSLKQSGLTVRTVSGALQEVRQQL